MLNGVFNDLEIGQKFVRRDDLMRDLKKFGAPPIYEKISDSNARLVADKNCTACNGFYCSPDEPVIESLSLAPTENMLKSLLGHWSLGLFKEEGAYE